MNPDDVRIWPMRTLVLGVASYLAGVIGVLVQLRSYEIATLISFGACVAVGGLIVVRRPGNLIGLTLLGYGSIWSLLSAGLVTADALDQAGRVDAAAWVTLVLAVCSMPTIWLIAAIWLLFPDGRASTPLDRKLLRWSGVGSGCPHDRIDLRHASGASGDQGLFASLRRRLRRSDHLRHRRNR